jgi:predicted DNA-binding helix-hairpin-helix protein
MDLYQKMSILGPGAQYDTCGPRDFGQTTNIPGVYHAQFNGHSCRLFKVLQTNQCRNNCHYCAFRRDRDCSRTTASSDEVASAFDSAFRRRLVDGLFLSSGIVNNADTTMTNLLDTVHILRQRYHYQGYVHLKIMPGSSPSVIREAVKVSQRISLNIESPTESDLSSLSPDKNLKDGFFHTLFEINKQIRQIKFYGLRTPSLTTQFIVGAGRETDRDLVSTTNLLYSQFGLKRVFYSSFRPVTDTPLAYLPPSPLIRQNRLYQTDFLLRFYNFTPSDLSFDSLGNLLDSVDPKTAWANSHPEYYPVNLNRATVDSLLRVPGLGPTSVQKIISLRQQHPIFSLKSLSHLRLQVSKLMPYVCF